jgi:hypothetical protein
METTSSGTAATPAYIEEIAAVPIPAGDAVEGGDHRPYPPQADDLGGLMSALSFQGQRASRSIPVVGLVHLVDQ